VRFARAQEVYAAVRHVVGAAIARAPWLTSAPVRAYSLPPPRSAGARDGDFPVSLRLPLPSNGSGTVPAAETAPVSGDPLPPAASVSAPSADSFFGALTFVGQVHRTYLVCEGPGELVLIDQHAAHERVAFQRLRVAHRQHTIARQQLLFPIPIEVDETAAAAAVVPEVVETLADLGFDLEAFGATTLLLRAVPELLKDVDPKPLLLDVLHRLAEGTRPELAGDKLDHVFATMACHSVVRAGDVLGRQEAVALLGQLDAVDLRSHCPHGRPVLLRMSLSEIERRFGRT
jgi:DNA mismatch repair protein MutL